ncbi:PPOX class F420-dependent oxidoreductase [Natrarchaeobius halalkaliphilus]|uniref:PPOX class F420-dependent oxidoreductase n=1 Tax=Natrarchaeobius halalkaliphilus TaxID=1679091 RepID=A0A3N6M5S4_9EURY|nr:PPOX class F420-dependent oxidoreductase [Natrarchaeobius halalkaliphilus]RQG91380.1 PPOX class F420-dependent oxidoreductase [Natrarchaeobius halalkaliphilus]
MASIPTESRDLFKKKKTFAHLATLLPDGAPHVVPVWVEYDADADRLLVNTQRGRRKEKNVRQQSRVAISMTDPDNPYRMLSVRGEVDDITSEGAHEQVNRMAERYLGDGDYADPQTERVIISIRPEQVSYSDS